ncbi:MAG: cytochrome c oxidase subunit II [Candidatus Heimdallarchaeota archaeon]|nr:cytochrome c oxidase subunit II [Candidatus Heimdallarchaeota archaeon]MDH5645142.1 cytochrome c oxidase subunit II [Candidatus Heimdallarchaeota archaeon]
MLRKNLISLFSVLGLFLFFPELTNGQSNLTEPYDKLFTVVTIISIIVALLVIGLWVFFIYKFRESQEFERVQLSETSAKKLEITWTVVAVVICVALMAASLPVLINSVDNSETEIARITTGDGTEIIIEGSITWEWFAWQLNETSQREEIIASPQPDADPEQAAAGVKTTIINLKIDTNYKFIFFASSYLMHSFFVPELNFKMDVVPGVNNTLSFVILEPGDYQVYCAEFCGARHSMMRAVIHVEA